MTNRAYLSLGSNINPEQNTLMALHLLSQQTDLIAVSSFWETEPVGYKQQPNFLNGAVIVETDLSAVELRQLLRQIEAKLKRERQANKNAPRTIDIDLIFFNQEQFKLGRRQIPNREVLERAFVAIPLAELEPDYIHPVTGQSLREIARQFRAECKTMLRRDDLETCQVFKT